MRVTDIARQRMVFLIVLSLIGILPLYGGGQNRSGTSAAPELLIPIGARYLAMGGSSAALASGVEAIYWNSAGLDRIPGNSDFLFSHRTYIADVAFNYAAVSGKFGFGSVALSLRALDIGDIPVTTETSPDGTGEIFSPTYFVLGLSYSKLLSDRVSVGLTTNFISESFGQVSSSGFALDAGVQYDDVFDLRGLNVGIVIKNIGPSMKYEGSGLFIPANAPGTRRGTTFYTVSTGTFELPSVVEIGVAYRALASGNNTLDLSTTFQNNNYAYDEYRVGAELGINKTLYLRGGYRYGASSSDARPDIFQNFTLGVGFSLQQIGGTDLSVDYAFVPVKYFSDNHVIALHVGF